MLVQTQLAERSMTSHLSTEVDVPFCYSYYFNFFKFQSSWKYLTAGGKSSPKIQKEGGWSQDLMLVLPRREVPAEGQ